ncbi:Uncharacterised protein [Mycobacteroides abscessus subsp. abscessus]|nr:Uncharacterised protein [Mycobacteroides abscessus subsp. abscessus]
MFRCLVKILNDLLQNELNSIYISTLEKDMIHARFLVSSDRKVNVILFKLLPERVQIGFNNIYMF